MPADRLAQALIEASPDGLLLVDHDGIILLANPVAAALFGRDGLVGLAVEELMPDEFRSVHPSLREAYAGHATSRPMGTGLHLFGQRADGEMFPVEISLSPIELDDGPHTIATIRDITDRQESAERLAMFQESAARLAMLQDRERIARDLHDMVIQRLFAAGMSLQSVQGRAQPPAVAERIASTIDELDNTIRELRSAIFQLGHQTEHRSLSAQLTELVHDRSRHLGFEPALHIVGDIDRLPDFIADQLVATVTEGLSNVVRHAQATEAAIRIEQEGDRLQLTISDNGLGLQEAPKRSGGLSNMMWRAAELGGSCTVERNDPAGTRLVWHVPV